MGEESPSSLKRPVWRRFPEVGTALGIRVVAWFAILFGRTIGGLILWIPAFYYALFSARGRQASNRFFEHLGEPPKRFGRVVRHFHTFARVALDRLFFLREHFDKFEVTSDGREHLDALTNKNQGGILLGSHLGSFEAMRTLAGDRGMKVSVVVDNRSAQRLALVLRELAPRSQLGIISVDPEGMGTAIAVKQAVARGELVGILADRATRDRNVTVDFLGAPAELPVGPFFIARTLKCPVLLVFSVFRAPNTYDLYCEPFEHADEGPREERFQRDAQHYANRLGHFAKKSPMNWFNMFDFWQSAQSKK